MDHQPGAPLNSFPSSRCRSVSIACLSSVSLRSNFIKAASPFSTIPTPFMSTMSVATVSTNDTVHTGRAFTNCKGAPQTDVSARVTKIVLKDINVVSSRDVGY